ncbi:MAG: ATP synthase F1 subunit delta [Planctomycetes bacterium]|nr:ATP synthase F1 subunit delta [Planctomycetota bacterium]MBL7008960.1 ATP synthase F1 subunit delta [Planctomycetota bacterium]
MAAQTRYSGPAARRYAKALFLAAAEGDALAPVSADVDALWAPFADPRAGAWLADPRVADADKRRVFEEIGAGCHALTRGLLQVLVRRRRHAVLAELPAAFRDLVDAHQGRLRGVVESARALGDQERSRIEGAFAAQTGKEVVLEIRENLELLGGIRVTLGGTRYDGSARGRLDKLRTRLAHADLGGR